MIFDPPSIQLQLCHQDFQGAGATRAAAERSEAGSFIEWRGNQMRPLQVENLHAYDGTSI